MCDKPVAAKTAEQRRVDLWLENGRCDGAIDACRERRVARIGNVRDWTVVEPDVFVASAIADTGRLVYKWIEDMVEGRLVTGALRALGIADTRAVRRVMAPRIPREIRARVDALVEDLRAGRIALPVKYLGPEFNF